VRKAITYFLWDWDAALLVEFEDGRVHGYCRRNGRWCDVFPGDIACKGAEISEARFKELFPRVGLPPVDFDAPPVPGDPRDDPRAGTVLARLRSAYAEVVAKLGPER
jgi:hypothetical protein